MPRESVRSRHDDGEHEQPELSVHWGRGEENVQVGITIGELTAAEYLGAQLAEVELTDEQRSAVVAALTQPHSGAMGWYIHLERGGVNRAIRTLRRARDQAFGADE